MDRSRTVPFKNLSDGDAYLESEVKFLIERWSEQDIQHVARWIDAGAKYSDKPNFLPFILVRQLQPIYDLRGIRLGQSPSRARRKSEAKLRLLAARLEYADFWGAHLEHSILEGAHFEYAILYDAHLENAVLYQARLDHACLIECHLEGANLQDANLEHADLSRAHLRGAQLASAPLSWASFRWCHLQNANLECASLQHADLAGADLEGGHLAGADLQHAHLESAHLQGTDLRSAHLEHADLSGADLRGANLNSVYLDNSVFRDIHWDRSPDLYLGFDVRGIRYSDPVFDQFVRQSEFVRRSREISPRWLFWLWEKSCDCGRGFVRLLALCGIFILAFALIFYLTALLGSPVVEPDPPMSVTNPIGYLYFSVVTFSTLGFGDVTPCNWVGQVLVMLEVLLGYVGLGALISVFSMKILPPR